MMRNFMLLAALLGAAAAGATAPPSVTMSPASVDEDAGSVAVTLTLNAAHDDVITVTVDAADDTAVDPDDYDGTSATVTFAIGATSATAVFDLNDDVVDEDDESFTATISAATDGAAQAVPVVVGSVAVTIVDDDPSPSLDITSNDGATVVGSSAQFTITLSEASARDVSFTVRPVGITATAGADFDGDDIPVTIAAGDTSASVSIDTLGDALDEDTETYKVTLVNVTNATYDTANDVTIGIPDDDGPPAISTGDDITVLENGTAIIRVELDAPSGKDITFTLSFSDDEATDPEDYDGRDITDVILAGATSIDVEIPLVDDALDEDDEDFNGLLSDADNAVITTTDDEFRVRISDDDAPPTCSIADASVVEDATTITVAVTLSGASGKRVEVNVDSANGTAGSADFTSVSVNNLRFEPGETSHTVSVTIKEDALDEVDETFTLALSGFSNCTAGTTPGTVTIVDDDNPPTVTINNANAVTEGANSQFTVTLSAASALNVTVDVTANSGTATLVDDFTAPAAQVTINAGQTTANVTVPTINDQLDEENAETFTLTLSSPVNAALGATVVGTGTLNDNDNPPTITIAGASVVEGDTGTTALSFPLTLSAPSGRALSVTARTTAGSADAGRDFVALAPTVVSFAAGSTTANVNVNVVNETTHDRVDLETFTVTIDTAVNVTIGGGSASATGTIDDNDPEPVLSIADATLVAEGNIGAVGLDFIVSLDRLSELQTTVTATPSFAGATATSGVDVFAGGVNASVAALASQASAQITILSDTIDEPDETFTVNLSGATNGSIGDGSATGLIVDDDDAPTLSIGNATVDEDVAEAVFTVTLSARSGLPVSASFATQNGTAAAGADFVASSGTLTIVANQLTTTVRVPLQDDALDELDETFTVVLSSPQNAGLLDAEGLGTLNDDDNAPNLSIVDALAVDEGDAGSVNASFRVFLSAPSGRTVTLPVKTTAVTADAADFTALNTTTLTFNAGVTEVFVEVAVAGDRLDEANETFKLDAQAGVSGATVIDGSGTATIRDDDDSPAAVADAYATDEEAALDIDVAGGVLANDSDGDGDALTVTLTQNVDAAAGSVSLAADGSFAYAPADDFAGAAVFTYSVSDGVNAVTGTATITVNNINDAPVVTGGPGDVRVDEDVFDSEGALLRDVLDFVDDADALDTTGIAVVALDDVQNGAFQVAFDGVTFEDIGLVSDGAARLILADDVTRLRLVPPPNENPVVNLTFVAWDGSDGSQASSIVATTTRGGTSPFSLDEGQLRFSVLPVNDGPELDAPTPTAPVSAIEGTQLVIQLHAADLDGPDQEFTIENNTLPATAVFDAAAATVTWTPTFDEAGTYTFDAVVDDSLLRDRRTITVVASFIDEDVDDVPDTVEATIGLDDGEVDTDGDEIADLEELGADILNPVDSDGDGTIDALDDDSDDDGILDIDEAGDGLVATPRVDSDADGVVDALDDDSDDDTVEDGGDNCRTVANVDQGDVDGDLVGDVCDEDRDGDFLLNRDEPDLGLDADDPDSDDDNILDGVEAKDAVAIDTDDDDVIDAKDDDSDGDGIDDSDEAGDDELFTAPRDSDGDGAADYVDVDSDDDDVNDDVDNCVLEANGDQVDLDEDGNGDACVHECGDNKIQQGEECDDEGDIRCGEDCQLIASAEVCDGIDNDLDGKVDILVGVGSDGERSACDEDIDVVGGGVLGLLGCSAGGGNVLWLALFFLPLLRRRRQVPQRSTAAWVVVAALAVSSSAAAQGIAVAGFQPAPVGTEDFVVVEGAGAAGHLAPAGAVTFDYANSALHVRDGRTNADVALLEHRLSADVAASLSIFDRFAFSLGVPVALYQAAGVDDTFKPIALSPVALGDLRLGARWAILDPKVGPAAALSTTVTLPTGDPAQLMGHGGFTVHPKLIGGWRFGEHFRVVGNLGYLIRPQQELFSFKVGNEVSYGVGAELPLPIDMPMWADGDDGALSALVELNGRVTGDPAIPFTQATSPLETAVSARYDIVAGHAVTAGVALGITGGAGTPLVRAFAAYSFTWPTFDKDKDGVDDENDGCPDRAEDLDGHDDDDGCPGDDESGEEVVDPDDDGIVHPQDLCPEDPEDKDGFEDTDGCPDLDHDGDGVAQDIDKCAAVPEDRDGFEDEDGCPDDDNDGDGFKDAEDKCKNVAEVRNGFEDEDGCPDIAPAAPTTTPAPTTDPAKPEPPPFMTEPGKIDLPQRIYFATAGADLTPEGKRLLDQVMKTMKDNPDIRVEIQGHTDGQGDNAANDKLALRRAQAVADYLVANGINRPRLLIAILGMAEPLAPNDTLRGRALNRRVEFRVIER